MYGSECVRPNEKLSRAIDFKNLSGVFRENYFETESSISYESKKIIYLLIFVLELHSRTNARYTKVL